MLDATQTMSSAAVPPTTAADKAADKTAADFEAMFATQMLAPMWEGLDTNGPFGGGSAEETWRGMLLNEYGKIIAHAGGVGIAHAVKAELLKAQEKT